MFSKRVLWKTADDGEWKENFRAESLQVTRENPRNLKEKDGDGHRERERVTYYYQPESVGQNSAVYVWTPSIHPVPLHLQPVLVNTTKDTERAKAGK